MKKYLVLFLLLLGGCTSLGRGLMEGYIDARDKKKDDVHCSIMSEGFEGLQRAEENTIKVLLVHGIGSHVAGHSMVFMSRIAQKMGMDTLQREYKEIQMENKAGQPVGTLRVYRFMNEKIGRSVIFYEQTWSDITEALKKDLAYDNTLAYAQNRSRLNAQMKLYLNASLPDTTIYFGPEGKRMLDSSLQSFCWMTNFSFDELPKGGQKYCLAAPKQAIESLSEENFVFITNSLGSRITIDALQLIADEMNDVPKDDVDLKKATGLLQNKNITVFMLANQLPLLQMGRSAPKHVGQYDAFCTPNGEKYNQRLFKNLNIVAISDPNDLLSYGLEPASADKFFDNALCPKISNVSITTAPAMDVGFGMMANPLSAHTGYQSNPYVLDLIVQGLEDGYVSPAVQDKCQWIKIKK